METGESFVLVRKQVSMPAQEGPLSIPAEPPPGKVNLNGPEHSITSFVSTLTSQHALELAKLFHEMKDMDKERKRFQKAVTDTLLKLEGTLAALSEMITKLEARTWKVEQRLREEEDRGTARSKVLAFLLSREKELRKKCAALEKGFLKKSAWLQGKVHRWKNP